MSELKDEIQETEENFEKAKARLIKDLGGAVSELFELTNNIANGYQCSILSASRILNNRGHSFDYYEESRNRLNTLRELDRRIESESQKKAQVLIANDRL